MLASLGSELQMIGTAVLNSLTVIRYRAMWSGFIWLHLQQWAVKQRSRYMSVFPCLFVMLSIRFISSTQIWPA